MKRKGIFFACSLVIPTVSGSLAAHADPNRIFWSPFGTNLGSPAIRAYVGSSDVRVMTPYGGGVLTAFAGTGRGHRIHFSPNGENLGGGPIVYDGSSPVTAMIPYENGVLTAFSNAGGNGHRIWFSPNGQGLGGGELRYDGSSPVTAMAPHAGGVLVAFSNAGGNGHRILVQSQRKRPWRRSTPLRREFSDHRHDSLQGRRPHRLHKSGTEWKQDSLEPERTKSWRRSARVRWRITGRRYDTLRRWRPDRFYQRGSEQEPDSL